MKDILELDYSGLETRVLASVFNKLNTILKMLQTPTRGEQVAKVIKTLSCPHCRAEPGQPCMRRRHGHHIKLSVKVRYHDLRRIKAEWVVDNERSND